ncbi:MAG: patatin-like protein [Pseudonocardiaceae bacterium]
MDEIARAASISRRGRQTTPAPQAALPADSPKPISDTTQEVRVATVLVGGVSLAIWMGGLMYEVERATRAREKDTGTFSASSPYRKLAELLDIDLQVDVLSGTSAGGINGAAFAVAQCRGGSVQTLRNLWFELGSFDRLLRSPYDKISSSLLRGDEILLDGLRKGFRALSGTAPQQVPPTELFLTTTFLTGELSSFRDDYGTLVNDIDHHGLFHFSGDGLSRTDVIDVVALAARSTASFPYAFEPSLLPVGTAAGPMHPDTKDYINATSTRYVVDGGVLANRPLGPALDAVLARTAEHDVRRVLAYVTPTTSGTATLTANPDPPRLPQALRQTVDTALAQSITGDLNRLREHNEQVDSSRRTRVHLARIAAAHPLDDPYLWREYWQRWAERTARELLAEASRQLRGVELDAATPPVWAEQLTGVVQPPRKWLETLVCAYGERIEADPPTLSNANAVLPTLGADFFEAAVQVVLPLVRAGHSLGADEQMVTVRSAITDQRRLVRGPADTGRGVAVAVRENIPELTKPGTDIKSWLRDSSQVWPRRVEPQILANAWNVLAQQLRTVAAVLAPLGDTKDGRNIADDRAVAAYLVPAGQATAHNETNTAVAIRLVQLVVAEGVLGGGGVVDQRVELVQMSADTRTELLRQGDGSYLRSTAAEKLAGLQLHHFGAFYKSAWRANDWMWGRLDGAGWLVHLMLDPHRIRRQFTDAKGFVNALVETGFLENDDLPAAAAAEVSAVFGDTPPISLPETALKIAAPLQRKIAREELPVLASRIRSDRNDGLIEVRDQDFLAAVENLDKSSDGDGDGNVDAALRACTVGTETIAQDFGSSRFIAIATTTAATVAATLDSAFTHLPRPAARVLRSLRAVTLTAYVMAKGLRRAGPIGLVIGIAIAVAGSTSGIPQTVAVATAAGLLLLLFAVGLRSEKRAALKVVLAVVILAAVLFAALAGTLPEPVKNWPLGLANAGIAWLAPRWWASFILVLLLLSWLLYSALQLGIKRRIPVTPPDQ